MNYRKAGPTGTCRHGRVLVTYYSQRIHTHIYIYIYMYAYINIIYIYTYLFICVLIHTLKITYIHIGGYDYGSFTLR